MGGPQPPDASGGHGFLSGPDLGDLALEATSLQAQHRILAGQQEGIDATAMLDRTDGIGRDAQTNHPAKRIAQQRGFLKVRLKAPPILIVGVANVVAELRALAGHGAPTCHRTDPFSKMLNKAADKTFPAPNGDRLATVALVGQSPPIVKSALHGVLGVHDVLGQAIES